MSLSGARKEAAKRLLRSLWNIPNYSGYIANHYNPRAREDFYIRLKKEAKKLTKEDRDLLSYGDPWHAQVVSMELEEKAGSGYIFAANRMLGKKAKYFFAAATFTTSLLEFMIYASIPPLAPYAGAVVARTLHTLYKTHLTDVRIDRVRPISAPSDLPRAS